MEDFLKFVDCLNFIKKAHAGQVRKFGSKEPYYLHCIRVYFLVSNLPNCSTPMRFAALLHDVLEDCPGYNAEMIEYRFGNEVAQLVVELTNDHSIQGTREFRKQRDRERLSSISPDAKRIKMCDRLDNLSEIEHAPVDFANKYLKESELLLEVIGDADVELNKIVQQLIGEKKKLLLID